MSSIRSVDHIRTAIMELIRKHEPEKLDRVDILMKKWKSKEGDLQKTLCEAYGEPYKKLKPRSIKSTYIMGNKLGTGGFAVVRKCKHRATSNIYALKIINKSSMPKEELHILESEIQLMRKCNGHPNIVSLIDVFESQSKLCLVLDCLEGGELFDRIVDFGHFTEANAAFVFEQLLSALKFVHKKQIVHRDIKPENLIFQQKCTSQKRFEKGEWKLKLIDFGMAKSTEYGPCKTPCGTPNYVAPEIIRQTPYGSQSDMWSCGVILYIILCGYPPFYTEDDNFKRLYRQIKKAHYEMPAPFWDKISPDAKDLVRKLLVAKPSNRLNATQALAHPWLHGKALDKDIGEEQQFNLRRFQYARRLRKGVRCILAVLKLIEALEDEMGSGGGDVASFKRKK